MLVNTQKRRVRRRKRGEKFFNYYTASAGKIECIKVLVELGADINYQNKNHMTPLISATGIIIDSIEFFILLIHFIRK